VSALAKAAAWSQESDDVVMILSREWKAWIERGGRGGRAKHDSSKSPVFLFANRGVQKFEPYRSIGELMYRSLESGRTIGPQAL
jgi:hypothetical protein